METKLTLMNNLLQTDFLEQAQSIGILTENFELTPDWQAHLQQYTEKISRAVEPLTKLTYMGPRVGGEKAVQEHYISGFPKNRGLPNAICCAAWELYAVILTDEEAKEDKEAMEKLAEEKNVPLEAILMGLGAHVIKEAERRELIKITDNHRYTDSRIIYADNLSSGLYR